MVEFELFLKVFALFLGLLTAGIKSIKFVQEGELGIKLRFGRALRDKLGNPRIIKPGFVLLVPWVETLKRHHVRQQTLRLDDQRIMIKQGLIFNVSAVIILRVKDIYSALFEIDELRKSLTDLSMGILRDVLAGKEYTELSDMEGISSLLLRDLRVKAEEWGVTFIQFKLTDCAPTAETAAIVSVEAAARMRAQALQKALRTEDFREMPPNLAAALVGIPMVTSISNDAGRTIEGAGKHVMEIGKDTFLEKLARKTREEG